MKRGPDPTPLRGSWIGAPNLGSAEGGHDLFRFLLISPFSSDLCSLSNYCFLEYPGLFRFCSVFFRLQIRTNQFLLTPGADLRLEIRASLLPSGPLRGALKGCPRPQGAAIRGLGLAYGRNFKTQRASTRRDLTVASPTLNPIDKVVCTRQIANPQESCGHQAAAESQNRRPGGHYKAGP